MKVCGVDLKGQEARLAILEGTFADFTHVACNHKKLTLPNDESVADVKSFRDAFQAVIRENEITVIGIKKRNKSGEYAGGPVSFKLEGIIQLLDDCEVVLLVYCPTISFT